jgi:uncharacterized protein YecE (DUF72 family)
VDDILIGTSGWHYPKGAGTWNGVFYPSRRPAGFDELTFYAEHFDTVEVNATFYRVPEPGMSEGWLRRTPDRFQFAVKLYQKFTHPDMYLAREGVKDWDLSHADVDQCRAGLAPLADAGRLAALLVQFPSSFHAGDETRDYLCWLLSHFAAYPLAVELRHRTWSDDRDGTDALLREHGAAWVLIDEPKFRDSIRQAETGGSDRLAYVRLHGRNAREWWDHAVADDRYNYLYSKDELEPFAEVGRRAAAGGRRVLMYMNNHFSAKAVANAAVLRHQLDQLVPGDYPPDMVSRYPDLEGVVTRSGLPF